MSLTVQLLGRPRLVASTGDVHRFRSRKSWAVLTYLVLAEHPPTRSRLAGLLFGEADDPAAALRWVLAEIRRGLGDGGALDGDPVVLRLAEGTVVDVDVLLHRPWAQAVDLPGLGADLLEGVDLHEAAGFETWLLAQQRRVAAASEAVLHEAALGLLSRGDLTQALEHAVRAAAMNPLDENHQALVVRLYRLMGDDEAAARQYELCRETFARELGVAPGPALRAALKERRRQAGEVDAATVAALVEAGAAAIAAGARDAGVDSLRNAARLADDRQPPSLRVKARLVLAEALVHSLRGMDEEGLAALSEADEIALAHGLPDLVAQARAELGYVDFLRARYDRAQLWLDDALARSGGTGAVAAKATTYLGSVESDRARYPRARELLGRAVSLSRAVSDGRREAFALSMLGRIDLLHGDLDAAAARLDTSIALAERHHWLAFLPWPQALRGEVLVVRGDVGAARPMLEQAFARACQLGDPCWEGMAARGLALLADAEGDPGLAFDVLEDARSRANRLADPYEWLDGYILDVLCRLGREHGHPGTAGWVDSLRALSSRTGMQELSVRALLHAAALGDDGAAQAAAVLAEDVDNPQLSALVLADAR